MILQEVHVKLDRKYQTFNAQEVDINPNANKFPFPTGWWTTVHNDDADPIYLDPGNYIHVRSVEVTSISVPGAYVVKPHVRMASVSVNIHHIADTDEDLRYYFTLSNNGTQTIVLYPQNDIIPYEGDFLATIVYLNMV